MIARNIWHFRIIAVVAAGLMLSACLDNGATTGGAKDNTSGSSAVPSGSTSSTSNSTGSSSTSNSSGSSSSAGSSSGSSTTSSGSSDSSTASTSATPSNVWLILQGESGPQIAQMDGTSTNLSSNYDEIGWSCVSEAASYNIYRSVDGGAYSLYATTTASEAEGTYSSYVSGQGSYPVMPLVGCAFVDSAANDVVTGTKYSILNVTGSTTAGSDVLTVSSVSTGSVTAGQGIGGPGIQQGTTIASFGSGGTTGSGGTGTYQLSQAATSSNSAATY